MEITPELLLKGKPTIIKGNEYLPTADYVKPFFDKMASYTDKFIVKVQTPDQLTITNGNQDTTYNRVWIQAVMPDEMEIENHKTAINLLYALDTRTPVVKIFKNTLNMACLNICVFNPDFLQVTEIQPTTKFNITFIDDVMNKTDETVRILKKMKSTFLSHDKVYDALGQWIDKCLMYGYDNTCQKVKLSENLPIKVYKDVYLDQSSQYYANNQESTYFNIYNAFTDIITNDGDKDLINKYEKAWLAYRILSLETI